MKFIISASRRTDLPAYYPEWTYRRFAEGKVVVKNPFNPKQLQDISLKKEDVLGIVFWTRYFRPMRKYLDFFKENYIFYIHYTLNNYPGNIETNNPPTTSVIEDIVQLSREIGRERIVWRYDPIFFTGEMTPRWHMENFRYLYERIGDYVSEIYVSILFPYKKTLTNLKKIGIDPRLPEDRDLKELVTFMKETSQIPIRSCASPHLQEIGITPGACINTAKLISLTEDPIRIRELENVKKHSTRPGCNCAYSKDIGAYGTCPAGCVYCYATYSRERALAHLRTHDPDALQLT